MKKLLFAILIAIPVFSFSQTKIHYYYPNKGYTPVTEKEKMAFDYLNNAYTAFNNNNMQQTRLFLDKAEQYKLHNSSFWYLLGLWAYKTDKITAAKRYWKQGANGYGCTECMDLFIATKFKKPIEPIIIEQQKKWGNKQED